MRYEIVTIPRFEKDAKRLKKRFPHIKRDLTSLIKNLEANPQSGTPLGDNLFKIRIPNSSIPASKSGGFRVITYYVTDEKLYLVTMYSKTDQDTIVTKKLMEIIQNEVKNI